MMSISPRRRRWFIFMWVVAWIAIGVAVFPFLAALVSESQFSRQRTNPRLHARSSRKSFSGLTDGDAHPHHNPRQFVWDELCNVRPRADVELEFVMGAIAAERGRSYRIRHGRRGIVRSRPIPQIDSDPVVLMVGDSHLYGVTDISVNASALIEGELQKGGHSRATVINAACKYYGPYQYVLRVRSLWDEFRPRVVVAVYFAGNDFLELDDHGRHFLNDDLEEMPRSEHPPSETTSLRRALYQKMSPAPFADLFWQGLNQAIYLVRQPQRHAPLLAKAIKTVDLLRTICDEHNASLVIAIIPSYDDYVDYELPLTGDLSRNIVRDKANRRLREQLAAAVREKNILVVDMFPVFKSSGKSDIYAGDFHIWDAGHQLLADALRDHIDDAIQNHP